jgi:hypothetical protein
MSKRENLLKHYNITKFYDLNSASKSKYRFFNTCSVNWLGKTLISAFFGLKFITYSLVFLFISACSVGNNSDKTDPVVVEQPIAFIKRPLTDADGEVLANDLTDPAQFRPGAVLYLKESATPNAASKDISSAAFSDPSFLNEEGELLYDVKDLHVSFDATKLLFSMRAPEIEDADEEDQPKWNIWEYDLTISTLKRLITSNVSAEEGHDISPGYLPNDRILFSSTRQRRSKAILLDEGGQKTQFSGLDENRNTEAFVLHTINTETGDDIQQITFNQSHDLYPILLENGKILFSRWDNAGQTSANGYNLYEINPDGTGLNYKYGRHSHDSGSAGSQVQFAYPQELENGNIAVQLREFQNENLSSQPTEINIQDYIEHDVQIDGTVEDLAVEQGGQRPIINGLTTASDKQSLKGSYSTFFPLSDGTNRYLVSWSVCRVQLIDNNPAEDENQSGVVEFCTQDKLDSDLYETADPLYGLWIYNANDNTQLPIDLSVSGFVFDEAVIMKSRSTPIIEGPATLGAQEQQLASDGFGVIHIKSVYDFDGIDTSSAGIDVMAQTTPEQRPQRFVRIEKPTSIPSDEVRDFDNTAYGRSSAQLMREIIGYAPIEPDGSVKVAVPANIAFAISVLDENGKRTSQRHQNWLQLAPGETIACIGCHTANSQVPHGRSDAQVTAVNQGAVTTGAPFPNTDPTLDPDMGETMAETFARKRGIRKLTPDIIFDDEWTDPSASPSESFSYAYTDLETPSPVLLNTCTTDEWTSICRISVNYEENIHPLWAVDRRIFDTDEVTLLEDRTCIACHTNTDDAGDLRVPDDQLDLSNGPSSDEADHFKSYRELLFNDNEVELVGGVLVDRMEDTGEVNLVAVVDENGDDVFDENGDQVFIEVPILAPVPVAATMSTNGALASAAFMSKFETGGSHEANLSQVEMKLLSEWLDLAAQYYNNPFIAPAN